MANGLRDEGAHAPVVQEARCRRAPGACAPALPNMFKVQRRIFAEQLELRFKVEGTPDKHTLLTLKLDPSVNTTQEDGIFSHTRLLNF